VPKLVPPETATAEETVFINTLDTILATTLAAVAAALGISIRSNRKLKRQVNGNAPKPPPST